MAKARYRTTPAIPPRPSPTKPGRLVCGCKKGYASSRDGMCMFCRGDSYLHVQEATDPLRGLGFNDCEVENG